MNKPKIKTQINCYIDVDLVKLARDYNLSFSELLEFGIKFKLSEKNIFKIPDNYLLNRISVLQENIKLLNLEVETWKAKYQEMEEQQKSQA